MNHPALKHIRNTLIAALGLTGCIEQARSTFEPALDALLDASLGDGAADAAPTDAARDAETPDGAPPDGAPPDSALHDIGPSDGAAVDAEPADALPDMQPVRPAPPCDGAPIPGAEGAPSGLVRCTDGSIDRVGPAHCVHERPPGRCPAELAGLGPCSVDSDCIDGAFGRCYSPDFPGDAGCSCSYGCATDDHCQPGQVCACSDWGDEAAVGRCVRPDCTAADDCPGGRCGLASYYEGCETVPALACRTADDQCTENTACQVCEDDGFCGEDCWPAGVPGAARGDADRWRCDTPSSVCGRPLRIAARPRLAAAASRGDWRCPHAVARLPQRDARRLAAHWAAIGALEHASVASFARFSLQLLGLGAPADLVADCQRAAADEVQHARSAYGIASAFAGEAIGPGPLALDDMALELDPGAVLREVIIEGCIGETLGALEAASAARECIEPAVRDACARIADDELRHAALGWRTARWLLACHPELRAMASEAFSDGIRHHIDGIQSSDPIVRWHGIATRPNVRRQAWLEVIAPLAAALLTAA